MGLVEVPTTMLYQSDRRTVTVTGIFLLSQEHSQRDQIYVLVGHINSDKSVNIFYKFSFFPNTISVWNNLPQSIALPPNLESFKSGISTLTSEGFPTHL